MKANPAIGDIVKVTLPGESPWAECVGYSDEGGWMGRIDNHLMLGYQHGLEVHDVVRFHEWESYGYLVWKCAIFSERRMRRGIQTPWVWHGFFIRKGDAWECQF